MSTVADNPKVGRVVPNAPWPIVPLAEVTTKIGSGATPRGGESVYRETGIPLIRSMNVHFGGFRAEGLAHIDEAEAAKLNNVIVQAGDVLLNITGASIGRVTTAPNEMHGARVNQHVCIIRPNPEISSRFLALFFASPEQQAQVMNVQVGATRQALTKAMIERWEVPVPPLPEQRRIVAEIEKQFTRLDAGVAALRRTQANLKRYRASVIEDILAVDWPKMQLSEIGEVVTGTTPSPTEDDNYGGYLPFITPADLNAGYHLKSATRHLTSKGAALARPLPNSSVLVTCIGATIGKTGLARFPCATNQQINAFIPHDMAVSPEWAFWMFSSPSGQRQIRENASATTLPILNKTRFGMLGIPVPPLEVQAQLVADIERRLTITDTVQKILERSLARADRLRLTLLETALAGRLRTT